jgi:hypothetical protein
LNKAIVDTTILTDVLLNSGEARTWAKKALDYFDQTFLPVYAIKEFKSGPLKNFVWMHNKLATVGSYEKALEALQAMSRTPKRYTTSTAIQALKEASRSIGKLCPAILAKKYGENVSLDKILCDELRIALKVVIFRSWKRRRQISTDIIQPLPCYKEVIPYEKRGLIELEPKECTKSGDCAMASLLKTRPDELRLMREAIVNSDKPENKRRAKVLRHLYRTPKLQIEDKDCRSLGDAIFVFLANKDTVILTTNISDHVPMANALGKRALSPSQILIKEK